MTTLAARPVDEPDLLALLADQHTALNKPFADSFRDACYAEAEAHQGWVDPNRVAVTVEPYEARAEDLHPMGNYATRRARGHRGHQRRPRRRELPGAVERRLERARKAWQAAGADS